MKLYQTLYKLSIWYFLRKLTNIHFQCIIIHSTIVLYKSLEAAMPELSEFRFFVPTLPLFKLYIPDEAKL